MNSTKIKICGLTRDEDIEAVNNTMPDYIGFVFARSQRRITFRQAERLKSRLNSCIRAVGVFVNEKQDFITELTEKGIIDVIQLHGDENEDYLKRLKNITEKPIIKAVSVKDKNSITAWKETIADFLLLDNGSGGTGRRFDWSLIGNCGKPVFLAGGINEDNINDAKKINPYCIDISSGAETNRLKDAEKIKLLIQKVRERI